MQMLNAHRMLPADKERVQHLARRFPSAIYSNGILSTQLPLKGKNKTGLASARRHPQLSLALDNHARTQLTAHSSEF